MGLRVDPLIDQSGGTPLILDLDSIDEDPGQPRSEFDEAALEELALTIRARGVRQPIVRNLGVAVMRAVIVVVEDRGGDYFAGWALVDDGPGEAEDRMAVEAEVLLEFVERLHHGGDGHGHDHRGDEEPPEVEVVVDKEDHGPGEDAADVAADDQLALAGRGFADEDSAEEEDR